MWSIWCFLISVLQIVCHLIGSPTLLELFFILVWLFSTVNKDGFKLNLETHLIPLLASKLEETFLESKEKSPIASSKVAHHPLLMQV